jgi:hypothetical protein
MYDVCIATSEDIPELLALQAQNQESRGGALSIEFPAVWFEMVVREMPIVIARRDGRLVGYLLSSTPEATQDYASGNRSGALLCPLLGVERTSFGAS